MNTFRLYLRMLLDTLIGRTPNSVYDIPIYINNYNRLDYLLRLIKSLESRDYRNIIILDNCSTYAPLLDYYKRTAYRVIFLKKNYGSKALWKSRLWWKTCRSFYVYTDPDLEIVPECPADFMQLFYNKLQTDKRIQKVGFSLKIDDLPDHYEQKQKVMDWEKQFWNRKTDDNFYQAPIDTTFALYRPFSRRGELNGTDLMYRAGHPYEMRHLPWYMNSQQPTEEEMFYKKTTQESSWAK